MIQNIAVAVADVVVAPTDVVKGEIFVKVIMENWKKFLSEMRPRYYPPGEAPGDPSAEEEARFEEMSDQADEIIDSAELDPNAFKPIYQDGPGVVYAEQGMFLLYKSESDAMVDIRADFESGKSVDEWYKEDRDGLHDSVVEMLKNRYDQDASDLRMGL